MAPCPSPFTPQQETQIVFQFGRLGYVARVWRWFRNIGEYSNKKFYFFPGG